jgi:hypothetical protein
MAGRAVVGIVTACLLVGAFTLGAVAEDRGGASLTQRVMALEASAERQRRAIDTLREDVREQRRKIAKLTRFRVDANERLARLERKASKLTGRGTYTGPVDNTQVQLGAEPSGCAGAVAEWNSAGTSLGCVPPV